MPIPDVMLLTQEISISSGLRSVEKTALVNRSKLIFYFRTFGTAMAQPLIVKLMTLVVRAISLS